MRRRRAFWFSMVGLTALVAAAIAVPIVLLGRGSSSANPADTAKRYLAAWRRHDWATMRRLAFPTPGVDLAAVYQRAEHDLGVSAASYRLVSASTTRDDTTAKFRASLTLRAAGKFEYDGALTLARRGDRRWRVVWSPAAIHPRLTTRTHFAVAAVHHPRADILALDGRPLTTTTGVVDVGVEPRRVKNRALLLDVLRRDTGADPLAVTRALDRPGLRPDEFVPVAQLTEGRYNLVAAELFPVPGTVFRRSQARVVATPELRAHVVGTVGAVTAELLGQLGPPYTATDTVGLSGLERTFERRLAGTPDEVVEIVGGPSPVVLLRRPGVAPRAVRTTLDLRTQRAAEAALAGVPHPGALVAIRPSTGGILAVVSTPTNVEFDRALDGRYPPGSTFKIVTSAALLGANVPADRPTTCPPTLTVDGRTFKNFEGESAPSLTFAQAFAHSCNTAFIQLGAGLSDEQLSRTAQSFGFGARFDLGLASTSGSFPTSSGPVEHAEAVIGQAKVTASPLEMASVAAAVAGGAWRAPTLVADPPPSAPPTTHTIAAPVVNALRSFMRGVVAEGTGTAAAVPGPVPVGGKTGTAEFGYGNLPPTHAWFVGYRGDLAFGILVEGAATDHLVGGRDAAPLAARFLIPG